MLFLMHLTMLLLVLPKEIKLYVKHIFVAVSVLAVGPVPDPSQLLTIVMNPPILVLVAALPYVVAIFCCWFYCHDKLLYYIYIHISAITI